MSFIRNPDNTVTFFCNYCGQVIGNNDSVVMFYRNGHYHPMACFVAGVENVKAGDPPDRQPNPTQGKLFEPVNLTAKKG